MAAVQSYIGLASLVVHTHSASQGQDLPGETQDLESMFPDLAQGHVASWWCLGSSGSAPPAVCIPDVLHGENVQTPAKPRLCENSCVTDTPSTQPGTNCLCPVWWLAGLAPPSRSGLVLHLQGRETSSYGHCALLCRVPPCSGCEPHDERAHPASHMCPTPQSMKHLVSDVSTVPGHKASYSVQCAI